MVIILSLLHNCMLCVCEATTLPSSFIGFWMKRARIYICPMGFKPDVVFYKTFEGPGMDISIFLSWQEHE